MSEGKLLVLDDDRDLTLAIAKRLRNLGYEVSTATTGDEAWRLFQQEKPDLVVLDLGLPDMDGLALCQRMKESVPESLVLVLTARGEENQQIAGLETGADDYVVKPVSLKLLVTRVHALLRRRPAAGPAPGEPLEVGMVSPTATQDPLWVRGHEPVTTGETLPDTPRASELFLATPGELWRVDQRWHLVSSPQVPANDLQMRRISMGTVEAGYIVEIIADANWVGSIKEVYLYNAQTPEEVRDPIARGYLLTNLYKRATRVQGVK